LIELFFLVELQLALLGHGGRSIFDEHGHFGVEKHLKGQLLAEFENLLDFWLFVCWKRDSINFALSKGPDELVSQRMRKKKRTTPGA
jgi:hypothetical protein